jgi:ABC-type maltose transport system permease subunit
LIAAALVSLPTFMLVQRYLVQGLTMGGMKG